MSCDKILLCLLFQQITTSQNVTFQTLLPTILPHRPHHTTQHRKDSDCRMICTKQKTSSPSICARTSERDWSTTGRSGKGFRADLSMRRSDCPSYE